MSFQQTRRTAAAGAGIVLAGVLLTSALGPARAEKDKPYGTLVGLVRNTSSRATKRRIFVEAGGQKWALHLNNTERIVHAGRTISVHDIDTDVWVKATGWRIGKLRLDVDRLDVIGDRAAYQKSRVHRKGTPDGYYQAR